MNERPMRFGTFEFDPATGELVRDGVQVRLQAQPARVLAVLLANAGDTVARDALQREVWGDGTHVDFERGLNFCIAQVRAALRDSADAPRYIVTVPRVGYRFIAPVTSHGEPAPAPPAPPTVPALLDRQPVRHSRRTIGFGLALLIVFASIGWTLWGSVGSPPPPTVVVVPFYNETGRPDLDHLAKSIGDAAVARLAAPERLSTLSVIGNGERLQQPFARRDVQAIAGQLGAAWVVIGQLKSDGARLRVIGHLIRASDMKHVWAQTFDDPAFALDAQTRTAEALATAVSQAVATN